jgi:Dolichyl-phosphate-mannose-protein mannosyltransferase
VLLRRLNTKLFLFLFLLFALLAPPEIDSTDGYIRLHVAKSIVERQRVDIEPMGDLGIPGSARSVAGRNHLHYSFYEPGQSIFFLPLILIAKPLGGMGTEVFFASMLSPIFSALTGCLILAFGTTLGYCKRTAFLVVFLNGFATFAFRYSKSFQQESQETFLALGAIYFWFLFLRSRRAQHWAVAVLCLGLAVLMRSTLIVLLVPCLVLSLRMIRSQANPPGRFFREATSLAAGLLPFILIQLAYNWLKFESIWESGLLSRSGAVSFAAAFSNPLGVGLYGLLFSPGKGLIWYAPAVILAPWAFVLFAKRHRGLAEAFICFVGGYLLLLSKYVVWNGGWDWGPRYLLPCVPLLIIPLGQIMENFSTKAIRGRDSLVGLALVGLALAGLIVQLPAIYVSHNAYYLDMIEQKKITGLFFIADNGEKFRLFNRIADAQIPRQFQIAAGTWMGNRRIQGRELRPDLLISTVYQNSPDKHSCVLALLAMMSLLASLAWVLRKELEGRLLPDTAIDASTQ